jgi:hypothetical protein
MSKKKEDGGPAFPHQPIGEEFTGMTLRDWFAGQALAGMTSTATMAAADEAGEKRGLDGFAVSAVLAGYVGNASAWSAIAA